MKTPLPWTILTTVAAVAAGAAFGLDLGARLAVDVWRERREARRGRTLRQSRAAWRAWVEEAGDAAGPLAAPTDPRPEPDFRGAQWLHMLGAWHGRSPLGDVMGGPRA